MPIPLRILRATLEKTLPPEPLTPRQQERRHRILQAGLALMAHFGRNGISFAGLASSLRIGAASLRWHYADLDAVLADILRRHLATIAAALDAVPASPNQGPALRAAYLAATRNEDGTLKAAHLLLTRERHLLPPDERVPIEDIRQALAARLAINAPAETIDVADTPWICAARIEPILATLAAHQAAPQAATRRMNIAKTPTPDLPAHIDHALQTSNLAFLAQTAPHAPAQRAAA